MKRYLFITAVFLATVLFTFAEPPAAPGGKDHPKLSAEERAQHHLERMTKELGLTTDQQAKLKPIMEAQAQAMDKIIQDKSLAKPERRKAMMEIMKEFAPQIEAVLTPDQQAKLKQMRAEHMKEGRHEHGPKDDSKPEQN
jgi:Spy/CpxP family protein refolding chaperone